MPEDRSSTITRLLSDGSLDGAQRAERLFPLVYDELRQIARGRMADERPGHTLQATALVHEAYMRLVGETHAQWRNRGRFFAAAAEAMRRILVEHARARLQRKRGGGMQRLTLHDAVLPAQQAPVDLLSLDLALQRLERRSARQCRHVDSQNNLTLRLYIEGIENGRCLGTGHFYWLFGCLKR